MAEHYAQSLEKQGRGPVQIISLYTGDVLTVYPPAAQQEGNDGVNV